MRVKSWVEIPTNGPGSGPSRPMLDRLIERIAKTARPEPLGGQQETAKRRKGFEHPVGRQR